MSNPYVVELDDRNQVRVRLAEYKGNWFVYLQRFWLPGPNSKVKPGTDDGWAFGATCTFKPEFAKPVLLAFVKLCLANKYIEKEELVRTIQGFIPGKATPAPDQGKKVASKPTKAATKAGKSADAEDEVPFI